MTDQRLHELLVTAPLPDDLDARRRSWAVVRAAFAQREPARRRPDLRPALALAAVAALLAATLSPPGEAVIERVREAIGIERAAPALFRLPAGGRLLVSSEEGPWVVHPDGSKRRLGDWREASWSPFGRFVVAARQDELVALEPDGDVRWKLARPDVRFPRWGGTQTDTRIAYLTGSRLHVVAGDGRGDVDAGGLPAAARVAPAWRPGARHVLAYADTRGRVYAHDSDAGSLLFRTGRLRGPRSLGWSSNGRLLVVTRDGLVVFGRDGRRVRELQLPDVVSAVFAPDGRRIAILRARDVLLANVRGGGPARMVFGGGGVLAGLAWSPNGRWLLVGWPAADQWIFVRSVGARRIVAVSNISRQFESSRFPSIVGWCCAP